MPDMSNAIRVGQISSVNPRNNTCRVAFDDMSDPNGKKFVSAEMQLLQHNTVNARNLTLPEVGEHVLCSCLPNGQEEGFILGSYYTASNMPEGHGPGVYRTEYADGTVIEYDLGSNTARIKSQFYVEVEAKEVKVTTLEDIILTAERDVLMTATANVKVTATQNVEIEATQDVTITAAQNVTVKATVAATVEAQEVTITSATKATVEAVDIIANASGSIKAQAPAIDLVASTVKIIGNLEVSGDLTVAGAVDAGSIDVDGSIHAGGDVTTNSRSLNNHSH